MNNIKNKIASKEIIESIINKYTGDEVVYINNIKKFQKAFIHKSFCIVDPENSDSDNYCSIELNQEFLSSNERLEFLGDKVIDLITTEFLFDKFPEKDEGFLTKLKSRLVKKQSLAYLSEKLGFQKMIMISSHVERISGRENPRFSEDLFESFMGILYKDQKSNLNICKKFLLGVYNEFIDLNELIENNDNYKDSLLRYFHSKSWGHPKYKMIYYTGNVYNREFTVILYVDKEKLKDSDKKIKNLDKTEIIKKDINSLQDIETELKETMEILNNKTIKIIGIGKGNTKKKAEQECSKDCLDYLKISRNY